jgi:rubrerythrin
MWDKLRVVVIMDEDIEKIKSMIDMENSNAAGLSESVKGISNVVVREILKGISKDSQKHAGFYNAILSLRKGEGREGEGRAILEEDYVRLEKTMKKHIEIELKMMNKVKGLLESEKDRRIRDLLMEIAEDEVKHHALMKRLLEAVIKRETIFEEDYWNMIWMDVPGHGAPIG